MTACVKLYILLNLKRVGKSSALCSVLAVVGQGLLALQRGRGASRSGGMSGGGSGRERRLEKYGLREKILAEGSKGDRGVCMDEREEREELMVSEGVQK